MKNQIHLRDVSLLLETILKISETKVSNHARTIILLFPRPSIQARLFELISMISQKTYRYSTLCRTSRSTVLLYSSIYYHSDHDLGYQ